MTSIVPCRIWRTLMATFVPIHAAGDGAWNWRLVAAALHDLGHDAVLEDLPANDASAGLRDYADTVVEAIAGRDDLSSWRTRSAASPDRSSASGSRWT
jgi:hypothetical protein